MRRGGARRARDGDGRGGAEYGGPPGGRTGPAAAALADRWEVAVALWSADVVAHGEALAAAGEAYVAGDEDAAAVLAAP
ncbi:hypothetical protein [Actinomycetospora sp. CA-053990]|uniref:hypothetical protein n=1 Tax=Actinomycetospora sp. CA-053990 TaxID=3239891 RepID=UPI003D8A27B0